jgi:protocatechuate 3,4-dioxygenase beta subunit
MAACFFASNAFAQECIPTRSDALGPYFVTGMPLTQNLNRFGKPGEALTVNGRILDAGAPDQAVTNARVEIWQTDGDGRYHPQNNGASSDYDDVALDLRGTVLTAGDGTYHYVTVIPGRYAPRPRHIHYRISAPGHETLVTQLYLSDTATVRTDPCRSGQFERTANGAFFNALVIYLNRD